ncbi:hypothetical protein DB346_06780 [Verrucomicrobia bacterium LW23]|nr:hypothetical protein DB346_06780 [Verrucomicrobia bacterium LW23]
MDKSRLQGLHQIPFSCKGSWFSFFRKNPDHAGGKKDAPLSIRVIAGTLWENAEVLDLDLMRDGESVVWAEHVAPHELTLPAEGGGAVYVAFQDPSTVRLRAKNLTLRLTLRQGEATRLGSGWRVRAGSMSWILLKPVTGSLAIENEPQGKRCIFTLHGEIEPAELVLRRVTSGGLEPEATGSFQDCVKQRETELKQWRKSFPSAPRGFCILRERELNTLWNLIVQPLGNIRRECTLVSKGSLIGMWSWDHCWHMLGNAGGSPSIAWNNLLAVFDHQDSTGALPDVFCANSVHWGHVKPPVHGWMLGLLEDRHAWFSDEHRLEIYEPLAQLTRFWLRERDEDGDGVPHYLDGCDSGWDNATLFDHGVPLEAPDLSTWLILQQEWLSRTAIRLGKAKEGKEWAAGARGLLRKMLEHFWTGERFVARLSGSHREVRSESLLLKWPLLLGKRIPTKARQWCLDGLMPAGRYRTPFGVLSEPRDSPLFSPDGYWRGAVWPVAVFIVCKAFRINGLHINADQLTMEFLRHVSRAGNYENYRGDNGEGVRDASIAWTATCALTLMEDLAYFVKARQGLSS